MRIFIPSFSGLGIFTPGLSNLQGIYTIEQVFLLLFVAEPAEGPSGGAPPSGGGGMGPPPGRRKRQTEEATCTNTECKY